MKKLLLLFMSLATIYAADAQVKTPAPSPASKLEQTVGLTDVSIEYSRPSVKGRTIFGDLVPYDTMWRTGANKNTMITFSTDATIDGQTVKAGSYAIFTKPGKETWDIYFYTDTENWGTPQEWDESKVAAKTNVKAFSMPFSVETFTVGIGNLTNSGATIDILWDNVYVGVDFKVPTDEAVVASINSVINGPSAGDYFQSAVYYLAEGKDIQQAKEWIDKAVEMSKDNPRFWVLRQQSLIHAKAGNKDSAIAAAKKSMELADKAGNADYVKMNKNSLKEWGAL